MDGLLVMYWVIGVLMYMFVGCYAWLLLELRFPIQLYLMVGYNPIGAVVCLILWPWTVAWVVWMAWRDRRLRRDESFYRDGF
ncbi:MAG: hypothetical protein GY703_09620 [Gammaproteobacteria bacterium]|nr:hypothetical protein [Gammaproteobacteria bacterium]